MNRNRYQKMLEDLKTEEENIKLKFINKFEKLLKKYPIHTVNSIKEFENSIKALWKNSNKNFIKENIKDINEEILKLEDNKEEE